MVQTAKFIGSKRALSKQIEDYITTKIGKNLRVIDAMAGAGNVSIALKQAGHYVLANDIRPFAFSINHSYIGLDSERADDDMFADMLGDLNSLPGKDGYFTKTFAEEARYFQRHNAMKIDAIRNAIDREVRARLFPEIRHYLIASLLLAADRVDSTTGVWMAYLKEPSPRSYREMELRPLELIDGAGAAEQMDVFDLMAAIRERGDSYDVTYIDPPYNGHSYAGNYHALDTIALNDSPEAYGIARKRVDVRSNTSVFNSKRTHRDALKRLFQEAPTEHVVVSYSNEGIADIEEVEQMLREIGDVSVMEFKHERYIGAIIGQHNRKGERVGEPTHVHNTEYLFHLVKGQKK